jgi:hypothetical protein
VSLQVPRPTARAPNYRSERAAQGNHIDPRIKSESARTSGSICAMQGILATAQAAFLLVIVLIIGWSLVWLASSLVERKLKGDRAPSIWSSFAWVWDNSNIIGIPTLVVGTLYILWAMNYGPGLGGPTLLILMLMGAAGFLIGFAPSLRGR